MPKVGTMLCAVPRIRKIIISNGADRARLKMSSPGRLVGQPFSSIIPGPAAERRSLRFVHPPTDRPTDRSTDRDLSPQRLSKLVRDAMKFSPRERYAANFARLPSFLFLLFLVAIRSYNIFRPRFFSSISSTVFFAVFFDYYEHEHTDNFDSLRSLFRA